jgi:predicted NBD/HSP70 family sugar kinase
MKKLTDLPLSKLLREQLEVFSRQSIQTKELMPFDVHQSLHSLHRFEGQTVLGVDIGGTTLEAQLFKVHNSWLEPLDSPLNKTLKSHGGVGYYDFLIKVCNEASLEHIPIGISYAGPLNGSLITGGPNVPALIQDIKDNQNDLRLMNWLPELQGIVNDAVSGLVGSACSLARSCPELESYIYIINGSGIGSAALTGGALYAAEAGHVPVAPELNPWGHEEPCEVSHSSKTCIEKVIAGKAGIERIWKLETNTILMAPEIELQYLEGNELAEKLYDNSATGLAHVIVGVAQSLEISLNMSTSVICHGGSFKFPFYRDRVQQILRFNGFQDVALVSTYDLSENACLVGAALLALSAGDK